MGRSDFLPSLRPHFVTFAWPYPLAPVVRSCIRQTLRLRARGIRVWLPLNQCPPSVEMTGPPRFLGAPRCTCPALRPRRVLLAKPVRRFDTAFRHLNGVGTHDYHHFEAQSRGLHTRCLRFADQVTLALHKTRFRLVASRYRVGLSPTGSLAKFQSNVLLALPNCPGLTWRTQKWCLTR